MERINQNTNLNELQANFFKDIGLWASYDFGKFKFRLSTERLALSPTESAEIKRISELVGGKNGFLEGAIKLYKMTLDRRFLGSVLGGSIRKTLTTNITSLDLEFINANLDLFPFITRLDLVKVKNPNGTPQFQIVEVEGDKTHAFGYVTFPKLIRNVFLLEKNNLGVVEAFKKELEEKQVDQTRPIVLFLNRSESFYQKELTAFAKIAKNFGINLNVALESEIGITNDKVTIKKDSIQSETLVNIPSLTPNGLYGSGVSVENLLNLYKERKINVLIPPYRFLGSKGLLGIFKNTLKDPALEKILEDTFGKKVLDELRPFIPESINVTKQNKKKVLEILSIDPENWVIKEISASGMRGVSLPGSDEEKRAKMLEQINSNPFNFIIQGKVEQATGLFTFSEPETPNITKKAEMFMRISPFITKNGLCEIGLTAREKPSVHGSTDSIQIPVIF